MKTPKLIDETRSEEISRKNAERLMGSECYGSYFKFSGHTYYRCGWDHHIALVPEPEPPCCSYCGRLIDANTIRPKSVTKHVTVNLTFTDETETAMVVPESLLK